MLEEALEHLVKGIVDIPTTSRSPRRIRSGRVLEVRVHPEDLGKVIGRSGRTAKALRTVVGALGGGSSPGRPRRRGPGPLADTRFIEPERVTHELWVTRMHSCQHTTTLGGERAACRRPDRPRPRHQGRGHVEVRTDEPELRFAPGAAVATDPASSRSAHHRDRPRAQRGPAVASRASTTATGAEDLRGTMLVIDSAEIPPSEDPDEFYDHQLMGLDVVTADGERVGGSPRSPPRPGPARRTARRPGAEVYVPFVEAIVPEIDLDEAARSSSTRPPGCSTRTRSPDCGSTSSRSSPSTSTR